MSPSALRKRKKIIELLGLSYSASRIAKLTGYSYKYVRAIELEKIGEQDGVK